MRTHSCLSALIAFFLLAAVGGIGDYRHSDVGGENHSRVDPGSGSSRPRISLRLERRAHSHLHLHSFPGDSHTKGQCSHDHHGQADGWTRRRIHRARLRRTGWATGEEAVLFLHPSEKNDGTMVVTGLFQGNFSVQHLQTGETVVGNGVPDVSAFDSASHTIANFQGNRVTLRELESTVQRVVGNDRR